MLNNNRINLGKALRPFEGYEMDHAVGTTYSLSLEALMFIPVTLFFGEELNVSEKVLSSEMLEALTRVPNQVHLFCQRGKMQKPSFYHNILAFWEKSIEKVQMESHLLSFHPKIWLVRYVPVQPDLPVKYKFICGSRNLTLCRDWDMAVQMEGTVRRSKQQANRSLLEFLQMLNERALVKKIKPEILDEIMHIAFDLNDDQLAYAFHPIGFNNKRHPLISGHSENEQLLVISPFVDKTTINAHLSRSKYLYLFSNSHELDTIDKTTLDSVENVLMFHPLLDQPFYAEPAEVNNDADSDCNINGNVEPDNTYNPSMNLHAKLYIAQNGDNASWFIGSANCTDPATARNIEFLTEISFVEEKATIDDVWIPLVDPPKGQGLFVEYERATSIETPEEKIIEALLRKMIYQLAALRFFGNASKREDGRFDMAIDLPSASFELHEDWKVTILPLSANMSAKQEVLPDLINQHFIFNDFEESQLTPFILCTIYYSNGMTKELVLDCDITFDGDRMGKIFKSILNSQDKLFRYLSAILTKEETVPLTPLQKNKNGKPSPGQSGSEEHLPLYEKLLLAASRDKRKIKLAAKTIDYLHGEKDEHGNLIVEERFAIFFNVFKPFADDL